MKNQMGITQEEMAMLLGISRIQYAMYETGRRDLPIKAMQDLAGILHHLHHLKHSTKEPEEFLAMEKNTMQQWLLQEQKKLHVKLALTEKKISALETKRADCYKGLEVVRFLELEKSKDPVLLESIRIRIKNTLRRNSLKQLEDLKIKCYHLELAKNKVEERIKQSGK